MESLIIPPPNTCIDLVFFFFDCICPFLPSLHAYTYLLPLVIVILGVDVDGLLVLKINE